MTASAVASSAQLLGQAGANQIEPTSAVVVPEIKTVIVSKQENLWRISRRTYGSGQRYTAIYQANRDQIRKADLIYPGQVFVLPTERVPVTK